MKITEVQIKFMDDDSGSNERLRGFAGVVFDGEFVVRDLKIIEGVKGLFVAMPTRKLTDRCGHCGTKNHLRSRYCNQCGGRLAPDRAERDELGRAKLHSDVAHPINAACREKIQKAVLAAYGEELRLSTLPGYTPRRDEFGTDRGVVTPTSVRY